MTLNVSFAGLQAWLKSKNWTAHSVAALAVTAATVYSSDQQVRDFVLGLLKNHPVIVGNLTFAVGVILKYSHSSSAAGTVATAEKVMASANPPTQAAVAAAQTNPAVAADPPPLTPKQ